MFSGDHRSHGDCLQMMKWVFFWIYCYSRIIWEEDCPRPPAYALQFPSLLTSATDIYKVNSPTGDPALRLDTVVNCACHRQFLSIWIWGMQLTWNRLPVEVCLRRTGPVWSMWAGSPMKSWKIELLSQPKRCTKVVSAYARWINNARFGDSRN